MTAPSTAPHRTARGGVLGSLRRAARWTRWYVRELCGENAYDHYLAHAERTGHPPLTRREFERQRTDRRDNDPRLGGRCC